MMRPGDLIFVRGDSFVSKAIRQITGGHFSHVEIWLGQGKSVGAHLGEGVKMSVPAEAFKGEDMAIGQVLSASDAQAAKVALEAFKMVGTQYDARGLAGVWLRFALLRVGLAIVDNPSRTDHRFFCSELAAWLYNNQGVRPCPLAASLTSPKDLYENPGIKTVPFNGA